MRDFPVFTTEHGVGSLVLKEIPYSGIAYVTIRDSLEPKAFLADCTEFCRAVGAEVIYASGHEALSAYPFHTAVIRMCADVKTLGETEASLFPITEETLSQWRQIYNEKMAAVPNASHMRITDAEALLKKGGGYFVHREGTLLGIGSVDGDRIDSVASVVPGAGADVVRALLHSIFSERVSLEVASTNIRALRLYEAMGFLKTKELSRWYKIF